MAITKKALKVRAAKWRALMEEWVSELRSGKYKQGTGALREVDSTGEDKVDRFCCLGVFGELCATKKLIKAPTFDKKNQQYKYEGKTGSLAKLAFEYSGLVSDLGDYDGNCESLAESNDDGKSFKKIAQFISQQLKTNSKKLFKEELFEASK